MQYNDDLINQLIEHEIQFSDSLARLYHYPDNITHLLYVMIPAFILKYGIRYQSLLEQCFSSVPILIDDKQDQVYQAYYFSKPTLQNGKYEVIKGIVLNNYQNIGLMQLLDNLVHEFNHAVNSMQNEFLVQDEVVLRTGLVYHYFDKQNLNFIRRNEKVILEEVINTKQTEMIIDTIRDFSHYQISNSVIQNTLYSIYHAIDHNYHSNSYLLESIVCRQLLQNKTFLSTVETLRFEGQISEIDHFFDSIVDQEGALLQLSNYLSESIELQKELSQSRWFRKFKIQKIQNLTQKALAIVQKFDNHTIYK